MAKFNVLGELVEHLFFEEAIYYNSAFAEVYSREKFSEDYLNAVGFVCNSVSGGFDKIRKVVIHGWRQRATDKEVSDGARIEIKRPNEDGAALEVRVRAKVYPGLFKEGLAEYIEKKRSSQTLEIYSYQRTAAGMVYHISDNIGSMPPHKQQILIEHFPGSMDEFVIKASTREAGYLVRDVLKMLNINVRPTDCVEVRDEKTLGDKIGDVMFSAVERVLSLADPVIIRAEDFVEKRYGQYARELYFG